MMIRWGSLTLAALVLTSAVADAAPADERVPGPRDMHLKLEQVSSSPYPYQAVRLRLCIVNGSSVPVGPVQLLDSTVEVQIKGSRDAEFKRVPGYVTQASHLATIPTARASINTRAPLFLESEEQAFLSLVVAAEWVRANPQPEGKRPRSLYVARPLFSEPGKHTLKCSVGLDAQRGVRVEQTIDIEVATPQGEDEAVLQLLKKDEALVSVLLHPIDPPEDAMVDKLKDLVERFPKSSYSDYARFALARGYWRNIGVQPPSRRVATALTADQLQKIVENRWDPKLEKVVPSRFAYLPNALVLWKSAEPLAKETTFRRLDRVYPDAVEWLEEVATLLMSANPERRKEAELLLGKKFPTGAPAAPNKFPPYDPKIIEAFVADEWRAYRKRTPKPEEEPRRAP